ncbi:hypothetical protein LSAT2_029265 [Lamellibrachia satsuma]|nr:hypothetical protein LSAT2_029265 [Lamellibrachia satsuma]
MPDVKLDLRPRSVDIGASDSVVNSACLESLSPRCRTVRRVTAEIKVATHSASSSDVWRFRLIADIILDSTTDAAKCWCENTAAADEALTERQKSDPSQGSLVDADRLLSGSSGGEPKKEPDSPDMNGQTKLDDSPPPPSHSLFTELQKPSPLPPPVSMLGGVSMSVGGLGLHNPSVHHHHQPQQQHHQQQQHNALNTSAADVGSILADYQSL